MIFVSFSEMVGWVDYQFGLSPSDPTLLSAGFWFAVPYRQVFVPWFNLMSEQFVSFVVVLNAFSKQYCFIQSVEACFATEFLLMTDCRL